MEAVAEEVVDGGVGAGAFGAGHGVAGDVAGAVGVIGDGLGKGALGGADVDEGLVGAGGVEESGEFLDEDVDGHGQDEEVALCGEVLERGDGLVHKAELKGALGVGGGAVPAEDTAGKPEGAEVFGKRAADEADAGDADGGEERCSHCYEESRWAGNRENRERRTENGGGTFGDWGKHEGHKGPRRDTKNERNRKGGATHDSDVDWLVARSSRAPFSVFRGRGRFGPPGLHAPFSGNGQAALAHSLRHPRLARP